MPRPKNRTCSRSRCFVGLAEKPFVSGKWLALGLGTPVLHKMTWPKKPLRDLFDSIPDSLSHVGAKTGQDVLANRSKGGGSAAHPHMESASGCPGPPLPLKSANSDPIVSDVATD